MPGGSNKKMNPFMRALVNRYFKSYNAKKLKLYAKENEEHAKAAEEGTETAGPIVFLGDSLTDNYDLAKFYPDLNCVNRGISGNTTQDVLGRMKVSVFDAAPSMVILQVGINDMMNEERTPEDTAADYERIVCYMNDRLPGVPIILESVYPGWDGDPVRAKELNGREITFPIAHLKDDINRLNDLIREMADQYGYTYADVHAHLIGENGLTNPEYGVDGCHLIDAGYEVATGVLRPIIDGLLG